MTKLRSGSFIPITLEQLARESGVLASDKITPCQADLQSLAASSTSNNVTQDQSRAASANQCIVFLLGTEINTASFAMYTFSMSVLLQSLLIISMSGAADHGRFRKTLLLSFALIGSTATMLFLPITTKVYVLGALLAITANMCFGASFVLLNSFLPLIVRYHPSLQLVSLEESLEDSLGASTSRVSRASIDIEEEEIETTDSEVALLPSAGPASAPSDPTKNKFSPELLLSTRISSNGMGIGYIAAVIVQIITVILVKLTGGSTFSLRLALFLVGAWWLLFTIPCFFWLRPRPGPPMHAPQGGTARTALAYVGHAWWSLGRTVMRARRLKDVCLFLSAWFLLSDAIATVSGTAGRSLTRPISKGHQLTQPLSPLRKNNSRHGSRLPRPDQRRGDGLRRPRRPHLAPHLPAPLPQADTHYPALPVPLRTHSHLRASRLHPRGLARGFRAEQPLGGLSDGRNLRARAWRHQQLVPSCLRGAHP